MPISILLVMLENIRRSMERPIWGLLLGPPLGVLIFLALVVLIEVIFGKVSYNDLHVLLIAMALGIAIAYLGTLVVAMPLVLFLLKQSRLTLLWFLPICFLLGGVYFIIVMLIGFTSQTQPLNRLLMTWLSGGVAALCVSSAIWLIGGITNRFSAIAKSDA